MNSGGECIICLQVARNEDLVEQIGKDVYFDLVDHDKVRSFRIQKQMPFNLFKVNFQQFLGPYSRRMLSTFIHL